MKPHLIQAFSVTMTLLGYSVCSYSCKFSRLMEMQKCWWGVVVGVKADRQMGGSLCRKLVVVSAGIVGTVWFCTNNGSNYRELVTIAKEWFPRRSRATHICFPYWLQFRDGYRFVPLCAQSSKQKMNNWLTYLHLIIESERLGYVIAKYEIDAVMTHFLNERLFEANLVLMFKTFVWYRRQFRAKSRLAITRAEKLFEQFIMRASAR